MAICGVHRHRRGVIGDREPAEERELARQPSRAASTAQASCASESGGAEEVANQAEESSSVPSVAQHASGPSAAMSPVSERLITKHSCASAVPEIIVAANVPTIERANARVSTSFRHLAGLAKDSQRGGCPEIAERRRSTDRYGTVALAQYRYGRCLSRPLLRCRPMPVVIRVMGPLEVRVDGQPIIVDTRKALAILALLAVEDRSFARDELAALLWPSRMTRLPGAPSVGRCPCCGTDSGAVVAGRPRDRGPGAPRRLGRCDSDRGRGWH